MEEASLRTSASAAGSSGGIATAWEVVGGGGRLGVVVGHRGRWWEVGGGGGIWREIVGYSGR